MSIRRTYPKYSLPSLGQFPRCSGRFPEKFWTPLRCFFWGHTTTLSPNLKICASKNFLFANIFSYDMETPQKYHLRGYSELFGKRAESGRELARGWPTRARMCSPDAQDSKMWRVGYPAGTLWWSAGPKSKISIPLWRDKNFENRNVLKKISKIDFLFRAGRPP